MEAEDCTGIIIFSPWLTDSTIRLMNATDEHCNSVINTVRSTSIVVRYLYWVFFSRTVQSPIRRQYGVVYTPFDVADRW